MHKPLLAMLASLGLMACFPDPPTGGGGGGGDGGPPADPCALVTAEGGAYAGYPYDANDFSTNVLPVLQASCELASGCHGAGSPLIRFQVFSTANAGNNCFAEETFNQLVARSDYMAGGATSDIVIKINNAADPHVDNADIAAALQAFIDNAKATFTGGGPGPGVDGGPGGGDAGVPTGGFDPTVFANQIQPILSNSSCMNTGCHNIEQGTLGGEFGLHPRAFAGSTELQENIANVVTRIDTSLPASAANTTEFYTRCTDNHAGSVVGNPDAIEAWIAGGLTQ